MKKCKTCKYCKQTGDELKPFRCSRIDKGSGGASAYFHLDAAFVVSDDLSKVTLFVGPDFGCAKHERQTKQSKRNEREFLEAFDGALKPPIETTQN